MKRYMIPLLSVLLAATSLPALAQRGDGRDRDRGGQTNVQSNFGNRGNGNANARGQFNRGRNQAQQTQQTQQTRPVQQAQNNDPRSFEAQVRRQQGQAAPQPQAQPQPQPRPQAQPQQNNDPRSFEAQIRRQQQQQSQQNNFNNGNRGNFNNNRNDNNRWNNNDRRGDWRAAQRLRNFNRAFTAQQRFRVGRYYAPRNFVYRRWNFGQFLPSIYWARDYWITDYYRFGFDIPPPGFVWVRFGPDALLIDEFTGEIAEVVYNVFY